MFKTVTERTTDPLTYTNFKAGKYITPAKKVTVGALVTGIAMTILLLIGLANLFKPDDKSILLVISLIVGTTLGVGVRLRASYKGKDQEY